MFETFEKDIDDSIFDSYYNYKKINRKDSVDDIKEIVDLHDILQKYMETKNDKYDVYKSLTYMEWVKDEFFLQFSYTTDEDLNSIEVIELCHYTLEPLEDGFLKLMQDELKEVFDDLFYGTGHKIGGYSYFTQTDPRDYGQEHKNDVSLLQIDSDDKIMFGDTGTAHFFINKDDLKNRNFNKVWMYWDCC